MLKRFLAPLAPALAFALILPVAAFADDGAPDEVVATVGGQSITRAELEKSVRAQLIEVDNQRYEILEEGLDNLVSEKLLSMEAVAQGKTLDAFQQELMTATVDEPSDEEVQKVYDDNRAELGDKALDEVKGRIVEYLKGQQRAQRAQALLTDLRARHQTVIKLSPPVIEVSDGGREARGPADAPITIIAFSDYECPFCKRGEETIKQVVAAYGDKVRYIHRDYPLPFHKNARKAAESARCAGKQGKFWEFYDALWTAEALSDEKLTEIATGLSLDKATFDTCVSEGQTRHLVDEDMQAGGEVGVSGTPAFFINGRILSGAQPFDRFKSIIDAELARTPGN
jgi:protein-disulfide isomerase